ncbi:hypothetical protein [Methanocella conradii]|uniref:hypothetical protein n=1 Tax=Methanocella conradii TaxID=1175444 RepID=UPI00157E071B|nr:hypothetical protein [Methanocella conradii]
MLDRPVIVDELDGMGLVLIGSVHSLREPAREIIKKITTLSPDYVCVELSAPLQPTKSFELEMARERYLDRFVCIDRPIEVTISRYMSGTRPIDFLKEAVVKYFYLPFNVASIIAFNNFSGLYKKLTGGRFFTFGWSEWDSRAYIFERDEYMAGRLASMLKSGELRGRCAVLVGRRHLPGMKCILEAFKSTNDIGSYYAGGRVYEVFSLAELEEPYTLSYEESSRNFLRNRLIEAVVRAIFLSSYVLALFLLLAALILMATAGALILIKGKL